MIMVSQMHIFKEGNDILYPKYRIRSKFQNDFGILIWKTTHFDKISKWSSYSLFKKCLGQKWLNMTVVSLNKDCPTLRTPNAAFNKVLKHKRGFLNKFAYVVKLDNLSVVRRPKKWPKTLKFCKTFVKLSINFSESERKLHLFKGSLDQSHYIFEINVGKSRIRHRTTLKLNSRSAKNWLNINRWRWRHLNSESFYVGSDSFRPGFQK